MNQYVTGTVIKELREKFHLTQAELAEKLNISDKTVSKWETAKGYPDISFIAGLASDKVQIIKLYPEGNAEARLKINGVKKILFYCNRDGLFFVVPVKGIDDKQTAYDDSEERKALEQAAKVLFG